MKKPFLEAYERLENQTLACEEIGIGINTVTQWKKDPKFAELMAEAHIRAQQKNNDLLRQSMISRAIRGTPRYAIKNGQFLLDKTGKKIVLYNEYETNLTMFVAKNRLPDEYRDKFEHEISGQVVMTMAAEMLSIIRRLCPPQLCSEIQKELETLSAKLVTT